MASELQLVRHAATEWSQNGRHTGRTDLPLVPAGEALARRLRPVLDVKRFTAAFTSDLQRARRTAALAGFPDAEPTALLREFDYGEYEGLTSAQIHALWPGWEVYHDGCPGGESPEQVYARAEAFLAQIAGVPGAVIAFSHGHFSRALAAVWTRQPIVMATHLALDAGGIGVLRDGDHGRVLQHWNLSA
ncbi:MAG: histidine phosphatase family protein [Candidatus Dormibacteraeota bacterium]|nr:histidine phosphatase family protein [Candidatus Dormibacteraeota bacterium]